jgi:4-carboxymuconolactone decarboxylase
MTMTEEQWQKGLAVVDEVYGPGFNKMMEPLKEVRFNQEIVANQFGNLWADPAMSVRDKRLMVLGATTMLGRADLIEVQMTGALINEEFTPEQLALIPLFMLFYAGAGNTTALYRGIEAAKANVAKKKEG